MSQHWVLEGLPSDGRLQRNRQGLILRLSNAVYRFRLHVYKITGSGRSRTNERRIEITTTYGSGKLKIAPGFDDVVLGFDVQSEVYVGFDNDRLNQGGLTHNASSFFDNEGLRSAPRTGVLIVSRRSELYGVERHAFFRPSSAAEYLLNCTQIHGGTYQGGGLGAGQRRRKLVAAPSVALGNAAGKDVSLRAPTAKASALAHGKKIVEQFEAGADPLAGGRNISPDRLRSSLQRAAENGELGEKFVFNLEVKRLQRAQRADLACQVEWTSLQNVAAGYDIASFNEDGSRRLIEVKSTEGLKQEFPMSRGEWRKADAERGAYVIARVTEVRSNPRVTWLRDPVALEQAGNLRLSTDTYRVRVVALP